MVAQREVWEHIQHSWSSEALTPSLWHCYGTLHHPTSSLSQPSHVSLLLTTWSCMYTSIKQPIGWGFSQGATKCASFKLPFALCHHTSTLIFFCWNFITSQTDLIKHPVNRYHISFWQMMCLCWRRKWQGKKTEGSDRVFKIESSVKIPQGKTHTCHSLSSRSFMVRLQRCTAWDRLMYLLSKDKVLNDNLCQTNEILHSICPKCAVIKCIKDKPPQYTHLWLCTLILLLSSNLLVQQ